MVLFIIVQIESILPSALLPYEFPVFIFVMCKCHHLGEHKGIILGMDENQAADILNRTWKCSIRKCSTLPTQLARNLSLLFGISEETAVFLLVFLHTESKINRGKRQIALPATISPSGG